MKFTDLSIRTLAPGVYYDEKTPAFGLRVGKYKKTWIVVKGRGRVKKSLGHYPALSLQDARKRALVALGSPLDPVAVPSFPDVLEAFLAQGKWRFHSKRVLVSSLKHFSWKRTLDKITHEDVFQALDAIKSPSARSHALKDIRSFFNWCIPRYLKTSPAQGIKMPTQPTRSRVLTNDELYRVWQACDGTFGIIVKLLILTGQRKSEIGTLTWKQIQDDRILIPAEVTKNGRPHELPLGKLAKSIINSVIAVAGATYLFHGSDGRYNGYAFHLKQLQKLSNTTDWTLHDLRRTFATGLASLNVPIHVTEKLLNHISGTTGGIVSVYQRHSYWTEQQEALTRWEERVLSLARAG